MADVVGRDSVADLLDALAEALDGGEEHGVLGAEMVHHGLQRHSGRRRDVPQADLVEPSLQEELECRISDPRPRGLSGRRPRRLPVDPRCHGPAHFRWYASPFIGSVLQRKFLDLSNHWR
jgi:hypothetical protein